MEFSVVLYSDIDRFVSYLVVLFSCSSYAESNERRHMVVNVGEQWRSTRWFRRIGQYFVR
jgi:hypothetical protein